MNNASLAMLKDCKKQIESQFNNLELLINKYSISKELSEKKAIEKSFDIDLRSIRDNIDVMKIELSNLGSEDHEEEYRNTIKSFKTSYENISSKIREAKLSKYKGTNILDNEPTDNKTKPKNIDQMNAQEAFDHGDMILNKGDEAINRMLKRLTETKDVSNNIKVDLIKQREQLEKTQTNLREIDYSLDRATKTLKTMLRSIATDKIVMGLILIIVLAIIAIIIVAAVGGDDKGNFNVPHDWIVSKPTNSNTAETTSSN